MTSSGRPSIMPEEPIALAQRDTQHRARSMAPSSNTSQAVGSPISVRSGIWTNRAPSSSRRADRIARRPVIRRAGLRASDPARPRTATARTYSPSKICKLPWTTPQRLCAFSSIASNTGARSPGEELMTCNTSAVAVCCSRACFSSALQASSCRRSWALALSSSATRLSIVAAIRSPHRAEHQRQYSTKWPLLLSPVVAGGGPACLLDRSAAQLAKAV